ncbi:MAG TPA: serine/threonine-protein kinase [Bryobacteraceae bacterium]|nr:serine/threonine-protein kinase [Bryobacteraceae bacterium]
MDRIGRYRIERELGRGAMGVVYHAIDPNIGRPVAIKTIRLGDVGSTAERTRLRERLSREARSAGILSHPGIVTIYDVDQEGEVAYIAMEFVDGSTLEDVLSSPQPVTPRRVFSILGQTAVALDYAHQKGIVHRDIKPANIMITADGNVKIADFGIAKITASEQFTMTGTIVGTPHYMAPEQVQGQPVDGRADQFSLAVVAFEMLTGDKPFTGDQLTTVVYKIVAEEPPRVQRFNSTLTLQIEHVLRKGLAKKPDARYKNCQEFIDALEDACASARNWRPMSRAAAPSEPTLPAGTRPHLPPGRSPRAGDTTTDAPRRRNGVLPLLFGILVAAGLVGAVAWQAAPWISKQVTQPEAALAPAAEPPAVEAQKPASMSPAENTAASAPPPAEQTTPEAPPAKAEEAASEPPPVEPAPAAKPGAPRRSATFAVLVPTDPPGATAILDGRPESECRTPCNLHAGLGRHRVTITMPGHQPEHRQIDVTGTPLEVPLVSLRAFGGTLMLSSAPSDAAIYIDDRKWSHSTPAQISLAPGTYNITVEKNGKRISERVEIRNGSTTYRKIPLDR